MKVTLLDNNLNKKITILLPSAMIKTKFFWKQVYKSKSVEMRMNYKNNKIYKHIYKQTKKYIKQNGHFVFMEVVSSNYSIKVII